MEEGKIAWTNDFIGKTNKMHRKRHGDLTTGKHLGFVPIICER